jgi:hypothetical protein
MASVDDVRAGIARANQQATESIAALQQASSAIEQAQSSLTMVTQGSGHADAEQANGLLADAARAVDEIAQTVNAAISKAESYASGL